MFYNPKLNNTVIAIPAKTKRYDRNTKGIKAQFKALCMYQLISCFAWNTNYFEYVTYTFLCLQIDKTRLLLYELAVGQWKQAKNYMQRLLYLMRYAFFSMYYNRSIKSGFISVLFIVSYRVPSTTSLEKLKNILKYRNLNSIYL